MKKIAVIDMGSNTIKLLVASANKTIISHAVAIEESRISEGISKKSPHLTDASIRRGLKAVQNLLEKAKNEGATEFYIVATSAVRDASNGQSFASLIKEETGVPVSILSGKEEAEAIALALNYDPKVSAESNYIHFDLGGGSLECNVVYNGLLTLATSLPLGAVRLTEQCVQSPKQAFTKDDQERINKTCITGFEEYNIPRSDNHTKVVFTGGSATISRALIHNRPIQSKNLGSNIIHRSELESLLAKLAPLHFEDRTNWKHLPANRADVVCAAIQILIAILNYQNKCEFHHSQFTLRHGIAAKNLIIS